MLTVQKPVPESEGVRWSGYVAAIQRNIEQVAEQLTERLEGQINSSRVIARFSQKTGSVELMAEDDEIFARIRVEGDAGSPWRMKIETTLGSEYHALLRECAKNHGLKIDISPVR